MIARVLTLWAIAAALSASACTVNQTSVPELTGPSAFAQGLTVTATPDQLVLGQQAVVIVEARDATGGPLANLRVHFDTAGCGRLSLTDVTTASDGRAGVVFTAPRLPLPLPECANSASGVTIFATPIGTNFQAAHSFSTDIRFLTPSSSTGSSVFAVNFLITPNAGLRDFTFADAGSVSPGHTITGYRWDWSDGATKTGSSVTHDFQSAGTYTATLTIMDDIGQSGSKTALLTVN